tara:strand:- start:594 stop:851 length:258 start_codon:yes stop_codon:yes gene_type:complete
LIEFQIESQREKASLNFHSVGIETKSESFCAYSNASPQYTTTPIANRAKSGNFMVRAYLTITPNPLDLTFKTEKIKYKQKALARS